ncbi:MAG: transposase, partial [Planctomycetota bacterium]
MSKKAKTPSFICKVPLQVSPSQEKKLHSKFEVARHFYNQCLSEAKKRLAFMQQSKQYQTIHQFPYFNKEEKSKQFQQLLKTFSFQEFDLHSFSKHLRKSYLGTHIDSQMGQKLASRAFSAVEKIWYRKAKRVRFKGKFQLSSIEGKSNQSGLKWRNNQVLWQGLKLKSKIDPDDKLLKYSLQKRVKYVRLLRSQIRGKWRFYAQLVLAGSPYEKPKKQGEVQLKGSVGLDLGPSSIAIVSEFSAELKIFCPELKLKALEKRTLQRKLDRQRRANNPTNYEANGTIKKGKKTWKNSKHYLKTRTQISEIERKLASQRKTSHGTLVNRILKMGRGFHFESLSYKGWQKGLFGKSVSRNAPGYFINHLKRKAESASARVVEMNTRTTKLSQTCHCGRIHKKKLSQRIHACNCGVSAQRDLYSAYLARFVDEENVFHTDQATSSWLSADSLLRTAWEKTYQTASVSQVRN